MESPLEALVARLAESVLDADTQAAVLAACQVELEAVAEPGGTEAPVAGPGTQPAPQQGDTQGPQVHLRSLTVEGFRGVGAPATISFPAGSGLTLVVGRNGSGKSSFAEALELLLTGDSRRWAKRTKIWKEGWQNLHHAEQTSIRAELDATGVAGPLVVQQDWKPGAALGSGAALAQVKGEPERPYAELGWGAALGTFRPFLSYNELGSILEEGPSKLFDALSTVLGLDDLVDVIERLAADRKAAEGSKAAKNRVTMLASRLGELDDERAVAALTARPSNLELAVTDQRVVDRARGLLTDPGLAGTPSTPPMRSRPAASSSPAQTATSTASTGSGASPPESYE